MHNSHRKKRIKLAEHNCSYSPPKVEKKKDIPPPTPNFILKQVKEITHRNKTKETEFRIEMSLIFLVLNVKKS